MDITRENLQQRYADLIDAELLRRLRSNVLTELAREVALAELASRGLSPDLDAEPAEPAAIGDIDFAPDEFERNPYQAPRVAAQDTGSSATPATRFGAWDIIWFLYVSFFVLFVMTGVVLGANLLDPDMLVEITTAGSALAGIVGWRLRRAWLNPTAWVVCLAINLAWLAVTLKHAWTTVQTAESSDLLPLFLAGTAVTLLLHLPLFWGVARYALFSPPIWRKRESRAAAQT